MADQPGQSQASAAVPWTWLAACQDCGQQHEYRPNDPNDPKRGGTWAAPGHDTGRAGSRGGPGHAYRARVLPDLLRSLYDEYQAEHDAQKATP